MTVHKKPFDENNWSAILFYFGDEITILFCLSLSKCKQKRPADKISWPFTNIKRIN